MAMCVQDEGSLQRMVCYGCVCMSRMKVAPSSSQRQLCYGARDAFYQCLVENNESEDACKELKEKYSHSCLQSWVSQRALDDDRLKED